MTNNLCIIFNKVPFKANKLVFCEIKVGLIGLNVLPSQAMELLRTVKSILTVSQLSIYQNSLL